MAGLEDRVAAGKDISKLHSVASFFVSRVDTEIDKRLDALAKASPDKAKEFEALKGKAAIANAKMAYKLFQESVASDRWKALEAKGATVQRPLWASTSTKNPSYRDVMYVEQLIGPDSVNTMPSCAMARTQNMTRFPKIACVIVGELATSQAVAAVISSPPHIQP